MLKVKQSTRRRGSQYASSWGAISRVTCICLRTTTKAHSRIHTESMCKQYFFVCDHVLADLSIGGGQDPCWQGAELC